MKNHNHYVKIPANYLEAKAKMRIPGRADQVLRVIERKTFGWHKEKDGISLSKFKELTGIHYNRNIQESLNILKNMNILKFKVVWGIRTEYQIQLDFSLWKPVEKPVEKLWKSCGKAVDKSKSTVLNNQDSTVLNIQDTQSILSIERIIKGRSIYREKTKNSPMKKTKAKNQGGSDESKA